MLITLAPVLIFFLVCKSINNLEFTTLHLKEGQLLTSRGKITADANDKAQQKGVEWCEVSPLYGKKQLLIAFETWHRKNQEFFPQEFDTLEDRFSSLF
jgi:hypothetical protein